MYEKENILILSGDFRYRFLAENECLFVRIHDPRPYY